ncbi:hypothetical protein LINPERPRIM_LOCUS10933 [Linum perenne]
MNLNDDQIDVAYYIFSRGLQTDEVLVKNNNYFCDRGSLWTLLPGNWVDSFVSVIILICLIFYLFIAISFIQVFYIVHSGYNESSIPFKFGTTILY